MHQSFVTTAPPPTGNSGDNDFSSIRALLKALHCGGPAESISPALYKSKFHRGIFVQYHKPGIYLVLRGNSKGHCPAIPVGGGAGVTNDWCISACYDHLQMV